MFRWLVLLLGLLLGWGLHAGVALWLGPPPPRWPAEDALPDDARLVLDGYVESEGGVLLLAAPAAGLVQSIAVEEGQRVTAKAELLRLDSLNERLLFREAELGEKLAELQLTQAREAAARHPLEVETLREGVRVATAQAEAKGLECERLAGLVAQQLAKRDQLELARKEKEALDANRRVGQLKVELLEKTPPTVAVQMAEQRLATARVGVERAREALDRLTLRAPAAGVVQRIEVSVGEAVAPAPGRPALRLLADGRRIVRCEVEESFADRVEVGAAVEVCRFGRQEPEWRGRVVHCGPALEPSRRGLPGSGEPPVRECRIETDAPLPLFLGQRVRVVVLATSRSSEGPTKWDDRKGE